MKTTITILACIFLIQSEAAQIEHQLRETIRWSESFDMEHCRFSSTGENNYFVLRPGYRLVFVGIEGRDTTTLTITVLNKTVMIGKVEARVVEERETLNGLLSVISRNYYALCTQTNSLFYFGEDVDSYDRESIISHAGSWRADSGGAKPGLMMPGVALLGSRYYQEIAPGVAMDRAEIIGTQERIETPAGIFTGCLKTEETTPLEPKVKEYKFYAPGIGVVKEGNLRLTSYGF